MRKFDEISFQSDIDHIPFHIIEVFDDIEDKYWAHNVLINDVIDSHAPLKTRSISKQIPYMNSNLRKCMNQRYMWRSRHFKNPKK